MASDEARHDIGTSESDSSEWWDMLTKVYLGLAVVSEIGLAIVLIWLTDFSDPIQRQILLAAAAIYIPLACLVVAIGARAERNVEKILKAVTSK